MLILAKKGEKYKCEACGLIVVVEDACSCEAGELICCEATMTPVKSSVKAKSKAKAKAKKDRSAN